MTQFTREELVTIRFAMIAYRKEMLSKLETYEPASGDEISMLGNVARIMGNTQTIHRKISDQLKIIDAAARKPV